jgi:serine/threonine-protein kinase
MTDLLDRLSAALADRYRVEHELGRGGMATVYLAHDPKHDRKVAVKVLDPDLAVVVGATRFLHEIKVTANLHHPHILPLHDSGEADGLLYYVMPYVKGESLRDRLDREGRLPVDEAITIARKVAAALDAAHREGIVHRDIKPENILLSAGEPIVADFGIARAVSVPNEAKVTRAGMAVGTPAYMSPEQAAAQEVDQRADVYALGAVLYEMLTGTPPYDGVTFEEIAAKRMFDPIPSARRVRAEVPLGVDRATSKALATSPGDRFASAIAFADALWTGSGEGGRAAGVAAPRRSLRRVGAALVVAVVAALTWTIVTRDGSVPARASAHVAVLPFTVRGGADVAYLGEGMVSLLSTKLDGAGTWHAVDPRAVFAAVDPSEGAVAQPAAGQALARTLDAELFVLGDIVEVGATVRLDAALYEAAGEPSPVAQASVEGAADDVLVLVDRLAAQLLVQSPGASGERLTRIAAVTTSSLPALKAYLRGTQLMWSGRFAEAGDALQEAVREDSTFALAWYQLSVAADWMLRADIASEASEQAVRFADRLAERDRRLLNALRTVRQGRSLEGEQLYRAIVSTYPQDVEAWYQLSEVLFHSGPRLGRPLAESRAPLLRLLALEPAQATARVHLARLAAAEGDVAELEALVDQVAGLSEGSRVPLEMRMLLVLARGDADELNALLAQLGSHAEGDLPELAWAAGSFTDNLEGVRAVVATMTQPHRSDGLQVVGRVLVAHLSMAAGQWAAASSQLDRAAALDPTTALEHRTLLATLPFHRRPAEELSDLRVRFADLPPPGPAASPLVWHTVHDGLHEVLRAYLVGLVSAALGERDAVARQVAFLERQSGSPDTVPALGDLALGVRAAAALADGDAERAAALLDALRLQTWHQLNVASPFYSLGRERFLRARAYQQVGRLDDAERWYDSFTNTSVHDLVYLAPSHFYRGEIAEARGALEEAVAHYQRVLELWSDADAALQPLVEEARARIAHLVPHP